MIDVFSSNGGRVNERKSLSNRFTPRLSVNDFFTRKVVSYQGNRAEPGFRWLKYKEGFSSTLVSEMIRHESPESVLDPFAGIGTTPLVAAGQGRNATGIEIMPLGVLAGSAISEASNGLSRNVFNKHADLLLRETRERKSSKKFCFPHVRITKGAFSHDAESEISCARRVLSHIEDTGVRSILELACVSVLEEASHTRKDGQYLRWDHRADRTLRATVDLGPIPTFSAALEKKIDAIKEDVDALKRQFGGGHPTLLRGSCLDLLKDFPDGMFDMVITSPPYANRYDYTRTYALELAWMGFDHAGFSELRQQLLSATVENKTKRDTLRESYRDAGAMDTFVMAERMYDGQGAIHEVLDILNERKSELGNKNVIRLVEHYFFEMALVIAELGRAVRPGGVVIMVNDNVQYHGEEVPVDFILSDFAESAGFQCENIWKLARGKGNSSQQMARFGRREIRKCVYRWVRK